MKTAMVGLCLVCAGAAQAEGVPQLPAAWSGSTLDGVYLVHDSFDYSLSGLLHPSPSPQDVRFAARLGVGLSDSVSLYTRLGVSYRLDGGNGSAPLAGAGLEYRFGHNWSTRFEYLWSGRSGDGGASAPQVSAGVLYRFDNLPSAPR